MQPRFALATLVVALGATSGCALSAGSVTRIADGIESEQSAVSTEAYAYYARGVVFEERGDLRTALIEFRAALTEDPGSAELNARVGSVECKLAQSDGDSHVQKADEAFERALELDAYSSDAWALSARCAARRKRFPEALERARKAASFDADSVELSLLVVQYAEQSGDLAVARAWLDGLLAHIPESREARKAELAFAQRHGDAARQLRAERALAQQNVERNAEREVFDALRRGDLEKARSAATRLRLSPGALALAAARESSASVAAEQAALALNADPNDSDAWVAALVAADLSGDRGEVERLLREDPTSPSPPNPLALELLATVLERLAGDDARHAWAPKEARASTTSR